MHEGKRSGHKLDVDAWIAMTGGARMIALDHPLQKGMPIYPTHPPFHITLNNRHGDIHRGCGFSSSNELIITSTHTSTHIDALSHVSENGMLYGGVDAAKAQQGTELFKEHGVETIAPIFRRGVLLDIARAKNVEVLQPAEEVTVSDLELATKNAGVSFKARRRDFPAHRLDQTLVGFANLSRPRQRRHARSGGTRRRVVGSEKAVRRRERHRGLRADRADQHHHGCASHTARAERHSHHRESRS